MRQRDIEVSNIETITEEPQTKEYVEIDPQPETKIDEGEIKLDTYFQLAIEIAQLEFDIAQKQYEELRTSNYYDPYSERQTLNNLSDNLSKTKDARNRKKLPSLYSYNPNLEQSLSNPKYLELLDEKLTELRSKKINLEREFEQLTDRQAKTKKNKTERQQREEQEKIERQLEESLDADRLHEVCAGNINFLRAKLQTLIENITTETTRFAFRKLKRDKRVIENSLKELENFANNLQSPDTQIKAKSLKILKKFNLDWLAEGDDARIMQTTNFGYISIDDSTSVLSEVETIRVYMWYNDIIKDLHRITGYITNIPHYMQKDIKETKDKLNRLLQRTERFTTNYPTEAK